MLEWPLDVLAFITTECAQLLPCDSFSVVTPKSHFNDPLFSASFSSNEWLHLCLHVQSNTRHIDLLFVHLIPAQFNYWMICMGEKALSCTAEEAVWVRACEDSKTFVSLIINKWYSSHVFVLGCGWLLALLVKQLS